MPLYQVGLLGSTDDVLVGRIRGQLLAMVEPLGLSSHLEVVAPAADAFDPRNDYASVSLFFGAPGLRSDENALRKLMRDGTPIIPVFRAAEGFAKTIPACLHDINGLDLTDGDQDMVRPATLALEVLGLLPRQRRVFISYKRDESSQAALQLFEHLSSLKFDVFLDTHGVQPGEEFQEVLWHRLSDSDVVVMLDTAHYFDSRWAVREFGRAKAKLLVPLRLGWPGVAASPRSMGGESLQFVPGDFEQGGQRLTPAALEKAGIATEKARSRGLAVRSAEMTGSVVVAVERIDGRFLALGPKRTILIELASGHKVLIYPSTGVPTAEHLHEVSMIKIGDSRAVVFDDFGMQKRWQTHLEWLSSQITSAKLLGRGRAAWELATWE